MRGAPGACDHARRMLTHDGSLQGKVALVTGAGSGIGKATAKLLARCGARVGALSLTLEEVSATCAEINRDGGESIALVADVSDAAEMDAAVQRIARQWQRLDIVIANAGINGLWAPLEEISAEEWDRTLGVNLRGTFLTVKHALPLLKRQGGAVVITSSVNGTRMFSNTGATAYASSKAAQAAFGRMIALELAKDRIRVNIVCPGAIQTEIDDNTQRQHLERVREPVEFPAGKIPLTDGKPGAAVQVAELIWFLVSDASSHITGTEVFIDGAQSLLQG